jgi:lysophospholipase
VLTVFPFALRTGNQKLNPAEVAYVVKRQVKANLAFKKWIKYNKLTYKIYAGDFDKAKEDNLPTIAVGVSGGGTRAALYGAGVLNALDGRNFTSVGRGTGGLLQATTYISGLSGGSWLLSSFIFQRYANHLCVTLSLSSPLDACQYADN